MYKKYKVKRKNKFNIYIVFAILVIMLFFMSYGYSLWSDKLLIIGDANIKADPSQNPNPPGYPQMNVDIPIANVSPNPQPNAFKVISNTVENGNLTTIIESTGVQNLQANQFTFYYTNKTGVSLPAGKYEIEVTGSVDAVTPFEPGLPAGALGIDGMGVFFTFITIDSTKLLVDTTIDIAFVYDVAGETQAFHYYIIVRTPRAETAKY